MDNNQTYRVHTTVGEDAKLDVHLQQNVGLLQILSLSLKQSDAYVNKSSNYGIIVGRVLANDAFGIENVRVSVFIPITDDYFVSRIRSIYPFRDITRRNGINDRRYNLLPDYTNDECHTDVGSFPNKRLVLDDNTYIEVFDKYYKYTTVTNKAGDYMIYGVPTGNQQVHIDLDLSDIGILSQKPRDFFYKGYGEDLFKNAEQFKSSTNLDNLVQIITQNKSVNVYPFWGDETTDTIAITRCDIKVDYEFETTCVFIGSTVTDTENNAIGSNCLPARYVGKNKKLKAGEGTIEMIRKTLDGYTEEYNIKGGRLIDGDGVWCYQIPMNLDYIQTDEEGNIIPSQDPNKGIATRARVRFRVSLDDMDDDGKSRHRAKYLVPNNPLVKEPKDASKLKDTDIYTGLDFDGSDIDNQYVYGSATQESDYRDLLWNKVYTVKSYIPRVLNGASKKHFIAKYRENNRAFVGIKSANNSDTNNAFPYNSFMGTISFSYKIICNILTILMDIIYEINDIMRIFIGVLIGILKSATFGIAGCSKLKHTKCLTFSFGGYVFIPGCKGDHKSATSDAKHCKDKDVKCIWTNNSATQIIQQKLADDFDVIDLDFSNDWVNGVLYFPMWHWLKKKKKTFFFGLFTKKAKDRFCNCDKRPTKGNKVQFHYTHSYSKINKTTSDSNARADSNISFAVPLEYGLIKEYTNAQGVEVYYYAPAVMRQESDLDNDDTWSEAKMIRLFATDIVLIGSLMNEDFDGVAKLFRVLPQTTANIPQIEQETEENEDNTGAIDTKNGENIPYGTVVRTGMDEGGTQTADGLFFGLTCNQLYPMSQGLINAQRICELGVNQDETHYYPIANNGSISYGLSKADAKITKVEMFDVASRAEFATYNAYPLIVSKLNKQTGYKTYNYEYKYPLNFDGTMAGKGEGALRTASEAYNKSYIDFRYGKVHHFYGENNGVHYAPVFDNSFYFYFGLNQGKTAIDKFRSKFYVDCVNNDSLPFPIYTEIIHKGASCRKTDSDFPAFAVNLKNASKPYEAYIKDSDGTVVFRVQDCEVDGLLFSGGTFDYSVKDYGGTLITSGSPETIEPQVYTIYVKDSNGKVSYEEIDMQIDDIQTTVTNFQFKAKSDTVNRWDVGVYNKEKSGYFTLDTITLDGTELITVTSITEYHFDSSKDVIIDRPQVNKFNVMVQVNNDRYFFLYSDYNQDRAAGNPSWTNIFFNESEQKFYCKFPASSSIHIVQLCPQGTDPETGKNVFVSLNDFAGLINYNVVEYEDYILTLNGVDIEGWVTDGTRYSNNQEQIATQATTNRINYYKPTSYQWSDYDIVKKSDGKNPYWEDVIEGYKDFNSNILKAMSIVAYKFNSLFDMCNILYQTTSDDTNVIVSYNNDSMKYYNASAGIMYPIGVTSEEQTENSMKSFNYDELNTFVIASNSSTYVHPKDYVVSTEKTISYVAKQIDSDEDGSTLVSQSLSFITTNQTDMYSNSNAKITGCKNKLLNGYSSPNNTFGFYNCMIESYNTDDDGKKCDPQMSAPSGATFETHIIEEKEVKDWVKNWLSFDNYDYRLGSVAVLYQKNIDDEYSKNTLFGTLIGGLYLATDDNHNVISDTPTGKYSDTSYCYDSTQFNIETTTATTSADFITDIRFDSSAPRTLYDAYITDDAENTVQIPYEQLITSDLVAESQYVKINPELDSFNATGAVNYVLTNNSWNIDLQTDINVVTSANTEDLSMSDNVLGLSGIVSEGNSFNVTIPECTSDRYIADYGTIAENDNYVSNFVSDNGWEFGMFPNIICDKEGNVTKVLLRMKNDKSSNGSIYTMYLSGGSESLIKKMENYHTTRPEVEMCDIANIIRNSVGSETAYTTVYKQVNGGLHNKLAWNINTLTAFTSNSYSNADNGTVYFTVPPLSAVTGKKDDEGIVPAETDFNMVVIEKYNDDQWTNSHLKNELYVISDATIRYELPFESVSGYTFVPKDGYDYYYYSKSDLALKKIEDTKVGESYDMTNIFSSDVLRFVTFGRGITDTELIALKTDTGQYSRIYMNN